MSDAAALRQRSPWCSPTCCPARWSATCSWSSGRPASSGCSPDLIHLSFTPVPIRADPGRAAGRTALGWRRAGAALVLYAVAGLAGVPWLAGHANDYVGASFGYVLGFIAAAILCGYLAGHGADRSVLRSVPVMVAGEVACTRSGRPGWAEPALSASAAIRRDSPRSWRETRLRPRCRGAAAGDLVADRLPAAQASGGAG